jgi:hypothetical protein
LLARGIPFTEKTVSSNADITRLKKLNGESSVPALSIGSQQLKGYSELDWNNYLDAAGYPKTNQLPPSYRRPAPTSLAPTEDEALPVKQSLPASNSNNQPPTSAPIPVAPNRATNTNPAGIQF